MPLKRSLVFDWSPNWMLMMPSWRPLLSPETRFLLAPADSIRMVQPLTIELTVCALKAPYVSEWLDSEALEIAPRHTFIKSYFGSCCGFVPVKLAKT